MPLETILWDPATFIATPNDVAAHLEAAFQDGDPVVIQAMLDAIARSKGMSAIAQKAGVNRDVLAKALCDSGDPRLPTLLGVLKALGFSLSVRAA